MVFYLSKKKKKKKKKKKNKLDSKGANSNINDFPLSVEHILSTSISFYNLPLIRAKLWIVQFCNSI